MVKPNLQGKRFNYLRVTHYMGQFGTVERFWRVVCEQWVNGQPCGNARLVSTWHLTGGRAYACEECSRRMGLEIRESNRRLKRDQRYEVPASVEALL